MERTDLLEGPLVVGVLRILIDEAIQALRDDGAVNQFINRSINVTLIPLEISINS